MKALQKALKKIPELLKVSIKGKTSIEIKFENSEEKMPIEEMIYSKGYPLEIHNVFTEDGFLLRMYRIPGGKKEENYKQKKKPPVFFQHGIFDSSDCWACNIEENNFIYILANKGFDIWLGNSRGNKYSKHHQKFSSNTHEFWSFSFHEMGKYDLPAAFDYITKINKSGEKIIYIGHSQGTAVLFSALTYNLDYFTSKLKLFIAFAPITTLNHLNSNIMKLGNYLGLDSLLKLGKITELMPESDDMINMNIWMYNKLPWLVHFFVDLATDKNSNVNNNKTSMKVLYGHYPSGGSFKSLNHFVQIYRKKSFCYYDYGPEANIAIYKQTVPKEYNLNNICDIPIALIIGKEDRLSSVEDARMLREKIKSSVELYMELDCVGHTGFLVGNDVSWFKNDVMDLILKYSKDCLEKIENEKAKFGIVDSNNISRDVSIKNEVIIEEEYTDKKIIYKEENNVTVNSKIDQNKEILLTNKEFQLNNENIKININDQESKVDKNEIKNFVFNNEDKKVINDTNYKNSNGISNLKNVDLVELLSENKSININILDDESNKIIVDCENSIFENKSEITKNISKNLSNNEIMRDKIDGLNLSEEIKVELEKEFVIILNKSEDLENKSITEGNDKTLSKINKEGNLFKELNDNIAVTPDLNEFNPISYETTPENNVKLDLNCSSKEIMENGKKDLNVLEIQNEGNNNESALNHNKSNLSSDLKESESPVKGYISEEEHLNLKLRNKNQKSKTLNVDNSFDDW